MVELSTERQRNYNKLEEKIGRTTLVKYTGSVPNENTILIKKEFDNPFGSHYDRVYFHLFKHYEENGLIKHGTKVLETTSGAAGVSFAGIGKLLGYDCYVALPAGGEKAREEAIKRELSNPDHLILTPAEEYISGFPKFLKKFLVQNRDYFFLNHSMGPRDKTTGKYSNNEVTLQALAGIADEALGEMEVVHYFVPAVGNGSSILGPARVFKELDQILAGVMGGIADESFGLGGYGTMKDVENGLSHIEDTKTRVVTFEPFQSAVAYDLMYPGMYEKRFGIKTGTLSRHRLPGTSFQGIDFPHIINSVEEKIIDEVVLVSDKKTDREYQERTGREDTKQLPHWDASIENHIEFGRSTKAGIQVALKIAEGVANKKILVLGYDKAERYDS